MSIPKYKLAIRKERESAIVDEPIHNDTSHYVDNSNEATPLAPSFQILKRPNVSGLRREEKEKINITENPKFDPIEVNIMRNSITLINADETFTNADKIFSKYLLKNSAFTTVSVVGRQDVGRSTVSCYLAGATYNEIQNCQSFFKQYKHTSSQPTHSSSAVSAHISDNRSIVLDSAPVLSSSNAIDAKHLPHFHLHSKLQNLRQLSYLMCISNVIIVVMESTLDLDLFRLILEAEKLKPNPNKMNANRYYNYYPDFVFVLNKATISDLDLIHIERMKCVIAKCFRNSNLRIKKDGDVNFLLLPIMTKFQKDNKGFYKAYKSREEDAFINRIIDDFGLPIGEQDDVNIMKYSDHLVNYVYSLPHRQFVSEQNFTEQDWFDYAKKCFTLVKKSAAYSEYDNFLLNNAY